MTVCKRHNYHHRHQAEPKNCSVSGLSLFSCPDYYVEEPKPQNITVREEKCSKCGHEMSPVAGRRR